MKLIQCANAYTALLALYTQETEYKTAYALVKLMRKLKPHYDFFAAEETKLVEEFAKKNDKGKVLYTERGTFVFADPERAEEYNKKKEELGGLDVEEEFSPRSVRAPAAIRPIQLEALDGFLVFEGE